MIALVINVGCDENFYFRDRCSDTISHCVCELFRPPWKRNDLGVLGGASYWSNGVSMKISMIYLPQRKINILNNFKRH